VDRIGSGSVRDSYPRLAHRYYALKAGWLHKNKLDYWDINAPLPFTPRKQFSWPEAREIVLTTFAGFSPQMEEIASRFFDEKWLMPQLGLEKNLGPFHTPPCRQVTRTYWSIIAADPGTSSH
jgi:oligoendopeptidase F